MMQSEKKRKKINFVRSGFKRREVNRERGVIDDVEHLPEAYSRGRRRRRQRNRPRNEFPAREALLIYLRASANGRDSLRDLCVYYSRENEERGSDFFGNVLRERSYISREFRSNSRGARLSFENATNFSAPL